MATRTTTPTATPTAIRTTTPPLITTLAAIMAKSASSPLHTHHNSNDKSPGRQRRRRRFGSEAEQRLANSSSIDTSAGLSQDAVATLASIATEHLTHPPCVATATRSTHSSGRCCTSSPDHDLDSEASSSSSGSGSFFTTIPISFRGYRLRERGKISTILITYATLLILLCSTYCSLCTALPCESHSWWDPIKDKCIPCTVCEGDLIPLRPCQIHRDTICGSIYDLKIDWVVLSKSEPNWKERRKASLDAGGALTLEHRIAAHEQMQMYDEPISLDWQTATLFIAVLACLLFFIVAAGILIHHMRQWRRMERRLDQDVEELSTKLMAKLAEVQSMEGGTFFIGSADALRVPTAFQPQHVLLPAEKPAKHSERRMHKTLIPGNVYIEENGSKG